LQAWLDQKLDLLITVPNATPAVPHNGLAGSFASCGYTFLFNFVDYPAGIIPVTKVDAHLDALSADFKPRNHVERGAYANYDADGMEGLPVGVQIIGRRLEEEWTLKAMELVEALLGRSGVQYEM
jgi:Asp-tRNA(Asn)/Glu-tRNA(Gln) amidotransferase A subunit family amidase